MLGDGLIGDPGSELNKLCCRCLAVDMVMIAIGK